MMSDETTNATPKKVRKKRVVASIMCLIYRISNDFDENVYVGQTWGTIKARFSRHCMVGQSNCVHLIRAIQLHGKERFKIECLLVTHTQEMADHWERHFIERYDSIANGYNCREGGSRGKHNDESRRKLAEKATGRKHTPETLKKMSDSHLGQSPGNKGITGVVKASDETKAKQSAALKGRPSPMKGRNHSVETRAKMSAAHKGRKKSPEAIAKNVASRQRNAAAKKEAALYATLKETT